MSKARKAERWSKRQVVALSDRYLNERTTFPGIGHFRTYVQGYFGDMDALSADLMVVGWSMFVATVGRQLALEIFWEWNNRLPFGWHSDVDPDGE